MRTLRTVCDRKSVNVRMGYLTLPGTVIVSGKAADGGEVTRILYLVSRFKPVLQISYCEIYHIGDELIAEIDVILPQSSTLHYAHDATETLQ